MVKIRKTGEFKAVDDKGNPYTIIKYTEFHDVSTAGSPGDELQGLDIYELPSGEHVNKISDTEFFAILNEITLHRI